MASASRRPRIAIVGGESVLGNELRERVAESLPEASLKLVGSEDPEQFILTEQGGEAVVMTALDAESLAGAAVVFLAGSAEASRKAMQLAASRGAAPFVIDLTYALEDDPAARLRAPEAEPAGYRPPAARVQVVAHPAAVVLACFLRALHGGHRIRRAVAHVFEPASERGRAGIDELQQQVVSLLSFKPLGRKVFDAQLGFNLLARYGDDALVKLESVEQRIEGHLATLLALDDPVPMPSLRLLQAPVMHGHSLSVWVELEADAPLEEVTGALSGPAFDVRGGDLDAPDVVGMAGQNGIAIGAIDRDRNNPRAAWYWLVADNFRVTADNAVAVARPLLRKAAVE